MPANQNQYAEHVSNSLRAHLDNFFLPIRHMGNVDFTHYLVSNYGGVYGVNSRSILSIYDGPGAYGHVTLYRDAVSYDFLLHRIVWSVFNNRPVGQGMNIPVHLHSYKSKPTLLCLLFEVETLHFVRLLIQKLIS